MKRYGMLWIAHGSRDNEWVRTLDEAWASVREQWEGPAFLSFLELVEGRLIQDGIDALEAEGVTDLVVVPLFVSSGSTHSEEIAWAFGVIPEPLNETDLEPFQIKATIHWCEPMNEAPELIEMVKTRCNELSEQPNQEVLMLVGHGSKQPVFRSAWQQQLDIISNEMQRSFGFFAIATAMLLPDTLRQRVEFVQSEYVDKNVIVLPLFISPGYYTRKAIPERLSGLNYAYNGKTLLPDDQVSKWAIQQALMRRMREEKWHEEGSLNI